MTEQRARIIEAVAEYGVLSRDQIRAVAGYASANTVNHALRALYHNGLLERRYAPPVLAQADGDHQALYLLDRRGAEFLAARRGLADWREVGWRRKHNQIRWWHLNHRRDTNQILIRLAAGARNTGCRLQWLSERELRRPERKAEVEVRGRGGSQPQRVAVVADAFVVLTPRRGKPLAFFVECDRGTVDLTSRWHAKVRAYDAFVQSDEYRRCYPLPPHTVGVLTVTTHGSRRAANLKAETERACQSQYFLFSTLDAISAHDPLRAAIWHICHRGGRHAILP